MLIIMTIGALAFLAGFVVIVQKFVGYLQKNAREEIGDVQKIHQTLQKNKEKVSKEMMEAERETNRIFVLYEMTREITKTLSQEEAFDIFKSKLRENVVFEDCLWLAPDSKEPALPPTARTGAGRLETLKTEDGSFVFLLNNEKEVLGHLLFKGVAAADKDKVMILSHQFALALRRVVLYQKVEQIAIHDNLTAVYTRRYLLERFEEEIRRAQMRKINLSFLMLDVDYFKNFNDQYGHLTGDQILKEIGAIIKASIREIDIAGRYGGEEFGVVLPDTDLPGALLAAERIRLSVEKTSIKAYDTVVKATVSIGAATFPVHGSLRNELLDKADWALYRAKKSGRNRISAFGVYA